LIIKKVVTKQALTSGQSKEDALELAGLYGGHSLRAGFATSAAEAGAEERHIANQTGHKNMTVLRRYIRQGNMFQNHALDTIGL
jgi:integrase